MVNSYEACKKGHNSADIQIEKGGTTMACKTTKKIRIVTKKILLGNYKEQQEFTWQENCTGEWGIILSLELFNNAKMKEKPKKAH